MAAEEVTKICNHCDGTGEERITGLGKHCHKCKGSGGWTYVDYESEIERVRKDRDDAEEKLERLDAELSRLQEQQEEQMRESGGG